MIWLTTTPAPPACQGEDQFCNYVLDLTDNEWLAAAADWLIAKPLVILVMFLIALLFRWLLFKLIGRLVARASTGVVPPVSPFGRAVVEQPDRAARLAAARRKQRAETMGGVLKSIATFAVFTLVGIMALSEVGVNVGPLIAGAGIVGVALGFGAQTLVRDFLSGIFMIFEDQYGIGDVVDLGDATGTVEAVTLRVTRLRDVDGTVWYVRNGEILRVGNMSQNWARTVLDVSVGYGEDLERVRNVLAEVGHEMWESEEFGGNILEEPEVWGVQDLSADGILIRVALKTAPLEQWAVARELRRRIKDRFDAEGIEIPFPQRVVWQRHEEPRTTEQLPAAE
jgi:moderate conductance mechanosensitive channel